MFPPIRCVGRGYPNATLPAIFGCTGRIAPYYFQFQWLDGVGWFESFNNIWQLAKWTPPLPGTVLVRTNWNTEEMNNTNISIQANGLGLPSRFMLTIDFPGGGGGTGHAFWYVDSAPFEFTPAWEIDLPFRGDVGGAAPVHDPVITVRIGTYQRLPAGSCVGA